MRIRDFNTELMLNQFAFRINNFCVQESIKSLDNECKLFLLKKMLPINFWIIEINTMLEQISKNLGNSKILFDFIASTIQLKTLAT